MAGFNAVKADFKNTTRSGYIPFYGSTGFGKVPKKLGFKANVQVIKKSNIDELLGYIQRADFVSLDTETTSLKWDEAKLVSINIGLPGNNNWIGFYYTGFFEDIHKDKLPGDDDLDRVVRAILGKPVVFMWNRYFDQRVLMATRGFDESIFWSCYDGLDLLWLLDTNVTSGLGLKQAAQDFLGLSDWGMEEDVWADILTCDPRVLVYYGGLDAYATLELGMLLYHVHKRHYPFMLRLHIEFKNALFRFTEQEQVLDGEYLRRVSSELSENIESVKGEFFNEYGVINLSSPRQKSDLLLRLGYSTGVWCKPAKDGTKIMSTAEELLSALAGKGCRPAELIIAYSKLVKLQSSYVNVMLAAVDSGKPVRFYFKDHNVNTMRLSAGAYNVSRKKYDYFLGCSMQTLPKPHAVNRGLDFDPQSFLFSWKDSGRYYVESGDPQLNLRKAICAGDGGLIVAADFSQEELCIPANLANETVWVDSIRNGADLHDDTGRAVFGDDYDRGRDRKIIKAINFSIMYEVDNQEYVIAHNTGWSVEKSREFFERYKAALPRLYSWKDKVMLEGRTTGSVKNMFGFERRVYPYFHTADRKMHKYGDRTCVNTSVQGLAAVLMRILMVNLWKHIYLPSGRWYGRGVSFVASVHDELVFRLDRREDAADFLPWFRDMMVGVSPASWPVKLSVEVSIGHNYGEMFKVHQGGDGVWYPKEEKRSESKVVDSAPVYDGVVDEPDEFQGFNFG
jgi:DNA polymerase I-like protein with 3'-5' exonuclease and polymerase domains